MITLQLYNLSFLFFSNEPEAAAATICVVVHKHVHAHYPTFALNTEAFVDAMVASPSLDREHLFTRLSDSPAPRAVTAIPSEAQPQNRDALVEGFTTLQRIELFVLDLLAQLVNQSRQRSAASSSLKQIKLPEESVCQLVKVAHVVCDLLHSSHHATQRDVYYRLEKYFSSQNQCNQVIVRLAQSVAVPRHALGIRAGSRGAIGGCLRVNGVDLRHVGPQGLPIDDELTLAVMDAYQQQHNPETESGTQQQEHKLLKFDVSEAKHLLIVEKDAVFHRLMHERLFERLPVVLLSGFGFPSAAASTLAAFLWTKCGVDVPFALVDCNPSGVCIMLQYAEAAERFSGFPAASCLSWLGVRCCHLKTGVQDRHIDSDRFERLTRKDRAMLHNLRRRVPDRWVSEIEQMEQVGVRADIEVIASLCAANDAKSSTLSDWVMRRVLTQDWV